MFQKWATPHIRNIEDFYMGDDLKKKLKQKDENKIMKESKHEIWWN